MIGMWEDWEAGEFGTRGQKKGGEEKKEKEKEGRSEGGKRKEEEKGTKGRE